MAHDVFISYSSKDKELADIICSTMENSGLTCWIAPRNIQSGKKYAKEIVSAIQDCHVMLLIFSESSNKSEHVENEIDIAFNEGKTIIPFKITDTQMSPEIKYYLNKKHWIDGVPEPEKCFEKLIEQVSLSVPLRSQEIKENELFQHLDKIIDEYKQKGIKFSIDKLIPLSEKLEVLIKEGKQGEDQEFQKLLDEFIQNELIDKEDAPSSDKTKINENKDSGPGNGDNGRYDMLQNAAGEIMIVIEVNSGEPDDPRIVYDGGSQALLYRSSESAFMLRNISEEARPALRAVEKILVVEIKDDDVFREYKAPIKNVKNLDHLLKWSE